MKINHPKTFRLAGMALMLSLVTLLSSCLKSKDSDYVQPYAAISVLNAYPDDPSFNIKSQGTPINTQPLIYQQNTKYLSFYAGYLPLTMRSAAADTVITDGTVALNGGNYYTLFIAPNTDETRNEDNEEFSATGILAIDDLNAPSSGKAKIRFANLSPEVGKFDIYIAAESGAMKDVPDTLFGDKAYMKISPFKEVDPAAAKYMQIHEENSPDVIKEISLSLEAGKIYTVFSCGWLNAEPGTGTPGFEVKVEENTAQ